MLEFGGRGPKEGEGKPWRIAQGDSQTGNRKKSDIPRRSPRRKVTRQDSSDLRWGEEKNQERGEQHDPDHRAGPAVVHAVGDRRRKRTLEEVDKKEVSLKKKEWRTGTLEKSKSGAQKGRGRGKGGQEKGSREVGPHSSVEQIGKGKDKAKKKKQGGQYNITSTMRDGRTRKGERLDALGARDHLTKNQGGEEKPRGTQK